MVGYILKGVVLVPAVGELLNHVSLCEYEHTNKVISTYKRCFIFRRDVVVGGSYCTRHNNGISLSDYWISISSL